MKKKKKRTLFDPAIYDNKVNEKSKSVLYDYELELKSKGLSDKTIYQYKADIKSFLVYVAVHMNNTYLLDLKRKDFRRFFLEMQDEGLSASRINRMQSSLRNILEYCEMDDDDYEDYNKNQMKGIKSLAKKEVREIFFLTDEQILYLIIFLLKRKEYQKALYVSLSYDSGARRGEIGQVEKYSFLDGSKTNTNSVVGKGGKEFTLFYMERTRAIAQKWLDTRGEDDIDSLWISDYGGERRELNPHRFYDWVVSFRNILEEAYQEEITINPHSFRHSAIENYYNGTHINLDRMNRDSLSLDEVRILAQHEDISTTMLYVKDRSDEILHNLFGVE